MGPKLSIYFKCFLFSLFVLGMAGCEDGDSRDTATKRHIDYNHSTGTGTIIEYYPSGAKKSKTSFLTGQRHGMRTTWYEDGQVELTCNYDYGRKEGPRKWYREDGVLFQEVNYFLGSKHGFYTEWWTANRVKHQVQYEMGSRLEDTEILCERMGKKPPEAELIFKYDHKKSSAQSTFLLLDFNGNKTDKKYYLKVGDKRVALKKQGDAGIFTYRVKSGQRIFKWVTFIAEGMRNGKKVKTERQFLLNLR